MGATRRRWLGAFLALQWSLGLSPILAIELRFDDVKVARGKVHFHTVFVDESAEILPIAGGDESVEAVSTLHYSVLFSLDDISLTKYGFFRYVFYVQPKSEVAGGGVTKFIVELEPTGPFLAQRAEVAFKIESAGVIEQGRISLPILNSESPDYLSTVIGSRPQNIEIGGETEIPISLENLQRWPVTVMAIRPASPENIWRETGFLVKGSKDFQQFVIGSKGKAEGVLSFRLVPHTRRALNVALDPRRSNIRHVTAYVDYGIPGIPRGEPKNLAIRIPIRFVPWPPLLLLAAALGALFGSLIRVMDKNHRAEWRQIGVVSLLMAILIEGLAMFLVAYDSEFRILGVTLDPFQIVSAIIIGVLVGILGVNNLNAARMVFPALAGLSTPTTKPDVAGYAEADPQPSGSKEGAVTKGPASAAGGDPADAVGPVVAGPKPTSEENNR